MLRREDNETVERKVRVWLEEKGIPLERYINLHPGEKKALLGELSIPKRKASDRQRRDLYRTLCLPDIAGREAIDPVEFLPSEELDEFLTPISPSETLSYPEMF